jgi:hypothetical protein
MMDLSQLKVPGPTIIDRTRPFWDAASEGRLLIQRCSHCHAAIHYPRIQCPKCWSEELAWEEASGRGRIKSYSEVWKPGHPGWSPAVPYIVALIELDEGPTMLSMVLRTDGEPAIAVGQAVRLAPANIGGRTMPVFRRTGE